jgi:hypothetical protein
MNYRLLLSEMLIDYTERMGDSNSFEKRQVYREIIRDLRLTLDIEPGQQNVLNKAKELLK